MESSVTSPSALTRLHITTHEVEPSPMRVRMLYIKVEEYALSTHRLSTTDLRNSESTFNVSRFFQKCWGNSGTRLVELRTLIKIGIISWDSDEDRCPENQQTQSLMAAKPVLAAEWKNRLPRQRTYNPASTTTDFIPIAHQPYFLRKMLIKTGV